MEVVEHRGNPNSFGAFPLPIPCIIIRALTFSIRHIILPALGSSSEGHNGHGRLECAGTDGARLRRSVADAALSGVHAEVAIPTLHSAQWGRQSHSLLHAPLLAERGHKVSEPFRRHSDFGEACRRSAPPPFSSELSVAAPSGGSPLLIRYRISVWPIGSDVAHYTHLQPSHIPYPIRFPHPILPTYPIRLTYPILLRPIRFLRSDVPCLSGPCLIRFFPVRLSLLEPIPNYLIRI